jgi:MSHA biogenesis protein MshM
LPRYSTLVALLVFVSALVLTLAVQLLTRYSALVALLVFVSAQPELDQRLAQTEFRQLRQRITFSYQLRAMKVEEVQQYIQHRLQVAGYKGAVLFSASLCKKITKASQGIPRLVNILCHKMLMLCYGQGNYHMTKKQLTAAIKDTESINQSIHNLGRFNGKNIYLFGAFSTLLLLLGYFVYAQYLSGVSW